MTRPRTILAIVVLSLLACGSGCRTPLVGDGRLGLPTFGAPEQWEPPVEPTAADPKSSDSILDDLEQDH